MPRIALGNGYEIDMADGWTFVHTLQDALDDFEDAQRTHVQNIRPLAPGRDMHSRRFASRMDTDTVQAHHEWAQHQREFLKGLIENTTALLKQYCYTETENTVAWTDYSDDEGSFRPGPAGGPHAM